VSKNQRFVVYCTAIKYGTAEDWQFLWEQSKNSNVAVEQITILGALGCSNDTKLLEKLVILN
jgi:aminopeptidase N